MCFHIACATTTVHAWKMFTVRGHAWCMYDESHVHCHVWQASACIHIWSFVVHARAIIMSQLLYTYVNVKYESRSYVWFMYHHFRIPSLTPDISDHTFNSMFQPSNTSAHTRHSKHYASANLNASNWNWVEPGVTICSNLTFKPSVPTK